MGFGDMVKGLFKNEGKAKNFKYLDNLINEGTKSITLDYDIILGRSEDKKYGNGIVIDADDLTIDGNGITIDAGRRARIFHIKGNNVILRNITFKNAFSSNGGAALTVDGSATLKDCIFIDNSSDSSGGAIRNGGKLEISGSSFRNNAAKITGSGGAIVNVGELNIGGCTFIDNHSKEYGGAIKNYSDSILDISGSTFKSNSSLYGGAISNSGRMSAVDCKFLNNNGHHDGGALSSSGESCIQKCLLFENTSNGNIIDSSSELTIVDCEISANRTRDKSIISNTSNLDISKCYLSKNNVDVGVISSSYILSVTDSVFDENVSDNGTVVQCDWGRIQMTNCAFTNNDASSIILNESNFEIYESNFDKNQSINIIDNPNPETSNMNIVKASFKDNNIEKSIVFNCGKSVNIKKSLFENNAGNPDSKDIFNQSELTLISPDMRDSGKTILNEGYILIKDSSADVDSKICGEGKFEHSDDMIPGGETFDFGYLDRMIHENNIKKIILREDICIERYEKDFYEGGIELDVDDLIIDGDGKTIDGADISRIFLITANNITLKNIIFKNGHSHRNFDSPSNNNGGAIMINSDLNVSIQNCSFINNESENLGGALYNKGELNLEGCSFSANSAKYCAGAIFNNNNIMSLQNSSFSENHAESAGVFYNKGKLILDSCSILNNSCETIGGALINRAKANISNSTLSHNSSGKTSGAISNDDELNINDCTFFDNQSKEHGGAISNFGKLNIEKSCFKRNIAIKYSGERQFTTVSNPAEGLVKNGPEFSKIYFSKGGGIYNKNELIAYDCTFLQNSAEDGGGIYNNEEMLISDCSFIENIADGGKGGSISTRIVDIESFNEEMFKNNEYHYNKPDNVYSW